MRILYNYNGGWAECLEQPPLHPPTRIHQVSLIFQRTFLVVITSKIRLEIIPLLGWVEKHWDDRWFCANSASSFPLFFFFPNSTKYQRDMLSAPPSFILILFCLKIENYQVYQYPPTTDDFHFEKLWHDIPSFFGRNRANPKSVL